MNAFIRIPFFALLVTIVVTSGCGSEGTKTEAENKTAETVEPQTPAAQVSFKDASIKPVYDHYIHLKNVLVKSAGTEAQKAAGELTAALKAAGNVKGAEIAGKIAATPDLAAQRAQFDPLTEEVAKTIQPGTLSSGKIYKQYCPMANDGNGGYWLSSESEIRNPYYGDDMLECGEVKEEIQ